MQVRYVDGSEVLPAGVQVAIVEGVGEVVVQCDWDRPVLLMGALSETLTAYAHETFIYLGQGRVSEYVYELARLPGEWARVVCDGERCRVLVDVSGPRDVVLGALSRAVTLAVERAWLWVGDDEVVAA